jgi:hypothetical protein
MGHLFLGLKSIKMKDSSKHRAILFQNYINSSLLYRIILKNPLCHKKIYQTILSNIFALYSLLVPLRISLNFVSSHKYLAIFEHANEIRCIKSRISEEHFKQVGLVTFSNFFNPSVFLIFLGHIIFSLRLFKTCKKLIKKNGVLIGTRQSQFLILYSLSSYYLKTKKTSFDEVFISTESNPNVIAIAMASQKSGKKVIYINHGFLDSQLGLFFHDHLIIQGKALYERISPFITSTPKITNVGAYYQILPLKIPIEKIKSIGIVLSLNPDTQKVVKLIDQIALLHPDVKIEIRPHPNHIFSNALIPLLKANSRVLILQPSNWNQFNPEWDFAIAGNTSAHIDLIAKGIPMMGMDIDENPDDLYGFYENNYILKTFYKSDIKNEINNFYTNLEWKSINSNYLPDASPIFDIT